MTHAVSQELMHKNTSEWVCKNEMGVGCGNKGDNVCHRDWWCRDLIYKKQFLRTYILHNMWGATYTKRRAGATFPSRSWPYRKQEPQLLLELEDLEIISSELLILHSRYLILQSNLLLIIICDSNQILQSMVFQVAKYLSV